MYFLGDHAHSEQTPTKENLIGVSADGFHLRITTLTPLWKTDWEREERLRYRFERPEDELSQEGGTKLQEKQEKRETAKNELAGKPAGTNP